MRTPPAALEPTDLELGPEITAGTITASAFVHRIHQAWRAHGWCLDLVAEIPLRVVPVDLKFRARSSCDPREGPETGNTRSAVVTRQALARHRPPHLPRHKMRRLSL
jgi:hypothetical protein